MSSASSVTQRTNSKGKLIFLFVSLSLFVLTSMKIIAKQKVQGQSSKLWILTVHTRTKVYVLWISSRLHVTVVTRHIFYSPSDGNSVRIAVTTTKKHVEEVEKLIRRHVKDAYCTDEIRDASLQDPPKALKGLITSLSGQVSVSLSKWLRTMCVLSHLCRRPTMSISLMCSVHEGPCGFRVFNTLHIMHDEKLMFAAYGEFVWGHYL